MIPSINKILVTGSSGTIGTRLCEKLLENDYEIFGIDKVQNKWNHKINELTIIRNLCNTNMSIPIPKDIDLVAHLAANARVYDLVLRPELAMENINITYNMLEFCRKNDIKRIIFSSSREIYGNVNHNSKQIESKTNINNCESPYAASKISSEALVHSYHKCYGINYIITRFSNVYGLYDNSNRVIPLFIELTKQNKSLIIYGKEKLLDFTYIDDTVSGLIKCIERFDEVKNDTFNIASGEGTSIIYVAQLIQKYMNIKNNIIIKENRPGEVIKFIADISKAKEKLHYHPTITFETGINKAVNWYNKQ